MRLRTFLLGCALLIPALSAWGQTISGLIVVTPVTVGTGSAQASGSHLRTYLALLNVSTTATVYCTLDGSAALATATAGQITLLPSSGFVWSGGKVPTNQINCIASASSTPFTILE
jgi:hypothetical protein